MSSKSEKDIEVNEKTPEILLTFDLGKNNIHQEYIPSDTSIPKNLYFWAWPTYNRWRIKLGLPLYYWHYRFLLTPYERKREDLQFVIHCFLEHDGEPDDKNEAKYFYRIYRFYQKEISYALVEILQFERLNTKSSDHYIEGYRRKWIKGRKVDPEFRLLYHGIDSFAESMDMYHLIGKKLNRARDRLVYDHKRLRNIISDYEKKSGK